MVLDLHFAILWRQLFSCQRLNPSTLPKRSGVSEKKKQTKKNSSETKTVGTTILLDHPRREKSNGWAVVNIMPVKIFLQEVHFLLLTFRRTKRFCHFFSVFFYVNLASIQCPQKRKGCSFFLCSYTCLSPLRTRACLQGRVPGCLLVGILFLISGSATHSFWRPLLDRVMFLLDKTVTWYLSSGLS